MDAGRAQPGPLDLSTVLVGDLRGLKTHFTRASSSLITSLLTTNLGVSNPEPWKNPDFLIFYETHPHFETYVYVERGLHDDTA